MDNVTGVAVVAGVVELVKNILPGKVSGAVTWVVAVLVGAVLGYLHLGGVVDVTTGLSLGAAAAGGHTLLSATRNK